VLPAKSLACMTRRRIGRKEVLARRAVFAEGVERRDFGDAGDHAVIVRNRPGNEAVWTSQSAETDQRSIDPRGRLRINAAGEIHATGHPSAIDDAVRLAACAKIWKCDHLILRLRRQLK